MKCPKSVSVVSWINIISSALFLISFFIMFNKHWTENQEDKGPIPMHVQYLLSCITFVINIFCGIMMLQGKNIWRLTYILLGITGFIFSFLISPNKLSILPGAIIFIIFALFLFSQKANEYFKSNQ